MAMVETSSHPKISVRVDHAQHQSVSGMVYLRKQNIESPVGTCRNTRSNGAGPRRKYLIWQSVESSPRIAGKRTSEASTQLTGPKLSEKKMLVRNIIAIPARCAGWIVD